MLGRLSLVTAPTAEPVTIDEAKQHLRVDSNAQDALITRLIEAAREHAERETRRAFVTQTWDWFLGEFPWECDGPSEVPKPVLSSVTSVTYLDSAGASTAWASTNYRVIAPAGPAAQPGRITLAYGVSSPVVYGVAEPITIRFVAGYAATAAAAVTACPSAIKAAILILVGEMYERRTEATIGTIQSQNTIAAARLLAPYRVWRA